MTFYIERGRSAWNRLKFKVIAVHNPQDFFNGEEPFDLSKVYFSDDLVADAEKELADGYQVIVTEEVNYEVH